MNSTKFFLCLVSSVLLTCTATFAADAKAAAKLGAVKPVRQTTALVSDGCPPVIIASANGAARAAAETLRGALAKRLGVAPRLVSRL
ncbi:MAG: hypothetical protein FJ388_11515, partial [Verrucomicrobia bacterium]|nr:hypothetical protein [Verrucomicrobiota bacterium]